MDAISILITPVVLLFGVFLFFVIYPLCSFIIDKFYECLVGGISYIFEEYDEDDEDY